MLLSGPSSTSRTTVVGKLLPSRCHVVEPAARYTMPRSVPTTSDPPASTLTLLDGTSGKFPSLDVQVVPPSVDSKTWPTSAPGPSVKRRENPFITTTRWFELAGSIATPPMNRFGSCVAAAPPPWYGVTVWAHV